VLKIIRRWLKFAWRLLLNRRLQAPGIPSRRVRVELNVDTSQAVKALETVHQQITALADKAAAKVATAPDYGKFPVVQLKLGDVIGSGDAPPAACVHQPVKEFKFAYPFRCVLIVRSRVVCLCGCKIEFFDYIHHPFQTLAEANLAMGRLNRSHGDVRLVTKREAMYGLLDFSIPFKQREVALGVLFSSPQTKFAEVN
jgi:hypothetical protein